jgi:hypothetical protein
MSVATTWPLAPTRSASQTAIEPRPAPTSRHRQPGRTSSRRRRERGSKISSNRPNRSSSAAWRPLAASRYPGSRDSGVPDVSWRSGMVQTIVRGFPRVNVFCKLPFVDSKGRNNHHWSRLCRCAAFRLVKNGVAAEQGTHDLLMALGTYAELYSVQFNKIPAKAAL